jgi:hypothetical protein
LAALDFDLKSAAPLAVARLGHDFHCGRIAPEWPATWKQSQKMNQQIA